MPTRTEREHRHGHRGAVIWLTGLSGAGKSTIASGVEQVLFDAGYEVMVLDGDRLRTGLNRDLGFGADDRAENVRRVGEVAALLAEAGMIVIVALISPFREGRLEARRAAVGAFHEIYVKADLAVCEARDPKGLYQRARRGEIADFTGISSPYEVPEAAELVVESTQLDADTAIELVATYVRASVTLDGPQHS